MVIAHNISALNTYKSLGIASGAANKSMEKLSSGYRINRAGDDAAGLSISEKMRSQIRGLNRASRNAQDGISMIQTAEGALNEQHSILQRMREIAVQSASDTNQDLDRSALQNEMAQLTSEINRIGNTTEFNGMKLLDGSMESKVTGGTKIDVAKGSAEAITFTHGAAFSADDIKLEGDGITFGTSTEVNFGQLVNLGNKNVIEIKKTAEGEFTVNITLTEAKAAATNGAADGVKTVVVDSEKMIKNDDGSFSYDAHGVSFSISKEEAEGAATDATTKLDLYEVIPNATATSAISLTTGTSFSPNNDYSGDESDVMNVKNFKLSEDYDGRLDYDNVKVTFTAGGNATAGTAMTLKVEFLSGGTTVVTDTITAQQSTLATAAENAFTYNSNGISFDVDLTATLAASAESILDINLDEKYGTEKIEVGGVLEDKSAYFHVGANSNQTISMAFGDMRAESLGLVSVTSGATGFTDTANVTDGVTSGNKEFSLNISTRAGANSAIDIIDNAINLVSQERSKYGAVQNRLEYTINNLNTSAENMQAAESRIRDVDMASEMMEMTKNNILQQAAQAMLVQANQRPQQALQLLQ